MASSSPAKLRDDAPMPSLDALEAEAGRRLGAFDAVLIRRLLDDESTSLDLVERALRAYALANSIGALAARRGWLTMRQIFEILTEQGANPEAFGDIAVRRKFLTPDQVAALADEQANDAPLLTIAELLVRMGLHVGAESSSDAVSSPSNAPAFPRPRSASR